MNVPGFEVVQIRQVGLLVVLAVAVLARILQPGLGVGLGAQRLALNNPGLGVGIFNPGAHALVPGTRLRGVLGIANNLPVAQHLRAAAGHQNRGQAAHHRADNLVAGQAAVAVGELLLGALTGHARGNHERRVRHHQVEAFTGHRVQQGTLTQAHAILRVLRVDIKGGSVQQQVKTGEGQGALRNIGGGHVTRVSQQVEGLNTAAGTHIQGTLDGGTLGNLRESQGGVANAEHVILTEHAGTLMRAQVRGHINLGAVVGGVRAQVNARGPATCRVALNQGCLREVLQGLAEDLCGLRLGQRAGQQEKRQQARQVLLFRTVLAAQNLLDTPNSGDHLVAGHRIRGVRAQKLLHGVVRVVQGSEALAQAHEAGVVVAAGRIRNSGVLGGEVGGRNTHAHHSTHRAHTTFPLSTATRRYPDAGPTSHTL